MTSFMVLTYVDATRTKKLTQRGIIAEGFSPGVGAFRLAFRNWGIPLVFLLLLIVSFYQPPLKQPKFFKQKSLFIETIFET